MAENTNEKPAAKLAYNKFDFKQFNKMTNDVAASLKVSLALGLLKDAHYWLDKFNNPESAEIQEVIVTLNGVQDNLRAASAARKAASSATGTTGQEVTGTANR